MKKLFTLAAVVAVAFFAPSALADTGDVAAAALGPAAVVAAVDAAPGPSLSSIILSTDVIVTGLSVLLGGLGLFAGGTWLTERRKRRVALAAFHAFHIIEDIAAENPARNGWDKAADGLKVVDEWMRKNGWRQLKPGEQDLVKLEFQALHGAQKVEAKAKETALSTALGALGAAAALAPVVAAVPQTPRGAQ